MIDASLALGTAKSGISLLDTILQIVKNSQKEGKRLAIAEVLQKMPPEAYGIASAIVREIEALKNEFQKAGISLDKSIESLQAEKHWWFSKKYRLVRDFDGRIGALINASGQLLQDFVALANCREADDLIAASFGDATKVQTELEAINTGKQPVGKVFEGLLAHARRVRDDLGKLSQ